MKVLLENGSLCKQRIHISVSFNVRRREPLLVKAEKISRMNGFPLLVVGIIIGLIVGVVVTIYVVSDKGDDDDSKDDDNV